MQATASVPMGPNLLVQMALHPSGMEIGLLLPVLMEASRGHVPMEALRLSRGGEGVGGGRGGVPGLQRYAVMDLLLCLMVTVLPHPVLMVAGQSVIKMIVQR